MCLACEDSLPLSAHTDHTVKVETIRCSSGGLSTISDWTKASSPVKYSLKPMDRNIALRHPSNKFKQLINKKVSLFIFAAWERER